jgi:hypothetical protein
MNFIAMAFKQTKDLGAAVQFTTLVKVYILPRAAGHVPVQVRTVEPCKKWWLFQNVRFTIKLLT